MLPALEKFLRISFRDLTAEARTTQSRTLLFILFSRTFAYASAVARKPPLRRASHGTRRYKFAGAALPAAA